MGGRAAQPERELTPAELHLGDRLAALIDGELGHDARERVLSHLATCGGCKAEADAQRRVKNVFADTAPPPPSDGLLARLQGLPGCGPGDGPDDGMPSGSGGIGGIGGVGGGKSAGGLSGTAAQTARAESGGSLWALDQLRGGRGGSALSPSRGFRIHEMERLSSRGRRFAFAAAGAVSLAAIALAGGVGTSTAGSGPSIAKGDSGTAAASSVRTASSGGTSDRERRRRDASGAQSAVSGTVLSATATSGDSSGAALKAGRGAGFQRGAPWAAPTAPPVEGERLGAAPRPALREAFFSAGTMWPARASAALGSYGYGAEAYAGLPADTFPGGAIRQGREAATEPVTTAAPPQR